MDSIEINAEYYGMFKQIMDKMITDTRVDDKLFEYIAASIGTLMIKSGAVCRNKKSLDDYDSTVAILVPLDHINDLKEFFKGKGIGGEIRVSYLDKAH